MVNRYEEPDRELLSRLMWGDDPGTPRGDHDYCDHAAGVFECPVFVEEYDEEAYDDPEYDPPYEPEEYDYRDYADWDSEWNPELAVRWALWK